MRNAAISATIAVILSPALPRRRSLRLFGTSSFATRRQARLPSSSTAERQDRVFTVNGSGTQPVLDAMNKAIFEQKSPVMLQNATVNYVAAVKGQSETARLLYKVDVKATIAGYVLQKETGNRSAIVDLDWRETLSSQSQDAQAIMSNPILDFGRFNLLLKS